MQAELERAISSVTNAATKVIGAGRTDAGVHATGQVISFRSATELDGAVLGRGVNALLPADIAVRGVEAVADTFHARFSATSRTYEYRIRNMPERDPLERHREHWVPWPIDEAALRAAAPRLVGRRELSAFAIGPGGVREVRRAAWRREGARLVFEIEADAFLRGMVRAIVGTLLEIGRGKADPADVDAIIASGDRAKAGPSAPAHGLCLVHVEYGEREVRLGDEDE